MTGFLKKLADTVGLCSLNPQTEVCVFIDGGQVMVAVPECCSEPMDIGVLMSANELEETLSSFERDDSGSYMRNLNISDMTLCDDGCVILYGAPMAAFF